MSARKLYFDRSAQPHQALVKNESPGGAAPSPLFVYGDNNPLEVYLADGLGGFDSDSGAASVTMKLGIVTPGSKPTGGTYKLQYNAGDKTAAIDYNATAAEIETALDAVTGVAVAVTGVFPCYVITWDATGAQNDITAATGATADNAMTPDGSISVSKLIDGDGSNEESLMLEIRRAPHTLQSSWTQITDGWSGDFDLRTAAICDLLGTASSVETTLEAEITDAAGKVYTIAQVPCKILHQGIDTGSPALNNPDDYYTETEADALFCKKAQDLADLASASTARTNLGISAVNTPYTPTTGGDWADPDPTEVGDALDTLAAAAAGNSNETAQQEEAITAAGETELTFTEGKAIHTAFVAVTEGTSYTATLIAKRPTTTNEGAPVMLIRVAMPLASSSTVVPTIAIYDEGPLDSTGDDILLATFVASTKRAATEFVMLVWDAANSAWVLFDSSVGNANGMQTLFVPARSMTSRSTNGAAVGTSETSTNKVMVETLDFDAATDEFAQLEVIMPKSWDAGTICFRPYWTAASGSGDVIWALQAFSLENNEALDTAFGTAATVTDTFLNASRVHVGPWSAALTIAGAAAAALTYFQAYRDADDASDTFSADAQLIGLEIQYQTAAGNDD